MRRFFNIVTGDTAPAEIQNADCHSFDGLVEEELEQDEDQIEAVTNRGMPSDTNGSGDWITEGDAVVKRVIQPKIEPDMSPSLYAMLRLRATVAVLRAYADETMTEHQLVLDALKGLAEIMVWADQNDPDVWDFFLEFAVMPLLVRCLSVTASIPPMPHDGKVITPEDLNEAALEENGSKETIEEEWYGYDRKFAHQRSSSAHTTGKEERRKGVSNAEPSPLHENWVVEPGASVLQTDDINTPARESFDRDPSRAVSKLSFSNLFVEEADETRSSESIKRYPSAEVMHISVDRSGDIQAQILKTISIVIQSVSRQQSLLCLFSANHINHILSFEFAFENDEVLAFFMSTVKSIALKLNEGLLQLFFDPVNESFPLYSAVTRFMDHPEAMVRIAVRNITLTIYALGDSEVLKVAAKDEMLYFQKTVDLLAKLCGSVALAFEFLLDDGREIRRTRSRTGLFRRRVRKSEVTSKLEEIENICAYLGDVSTVSQAYLHPLIVTLTSSRLFSPFFRPIASLASPVALQSRKQWRISRTDSTSEPTPALPLFDAVARCLVLACLLTHCKVSPLGSVLVRDLCRPASEFEGRHVLHGLKAMATDITGTERATFISLCAIEAFINCQAASRQLLSSLKYDFYLDDADDVARDGFFGTGAPFINIGVPDEDDLQRRGSEPLLMTLSEFEAPLTPTASRPDTPTLQNAGSVDGMKTPPNDSQDSRMSSFDSNPGLSLSPQFPSNSSLQKSNSDGILSSFQHGETSLREAISSIVLVVRRREVRTLRVLYAIARIIDAVEKRTNDTNSCVDVAKIMLDELAEVLNRYMTNKRTTIVSIEQMFDNFRASVVNMGRYTEARLDLEQILSADRVPLLASECPKGAGKRRRIHSEDLTPPVEIEDAHSFIIITSVYDEALKRANVLDKFGSLAKEVEDVLTANGVEDSYLEKRYALEDTSKAVLQHGIAL